MFMRETFRGDHLAILLAIILGLAIGYCTQADAKALQQYTLGNTIIKAKVQGRANGLTYVSVHDDENTSVSAVRSIISKYGGILVELSHSGRRNISFTLAGKKYAFDPNRMFSDRGIKASLQAQGRSYTKEAHVAVASFAGWFVAILKQQSGGRLFVALHNSTEGGYSFESYASGNLRREAKAIHRNAQMDVDDFFFTTSSGLFASLKRADQNVVLQSRGATDDGSLSVYSARRGIPYLNIEAQHGHAKQQLQMLIVLQKE